MSRDFVPLTECIHGSKITPCNEVCPFELNVRDIMAKIKKGSFISAYNMLRETVLFPYVSCNLCSAPCLKRCKETLDDGFVDIRALELFLSGSFRDKDPINYGTPSLGKTVAILGSGLGAMAAALKFAQNGYTVSVFEERDELCKEISDILGKEIIEKDILHQFKYSPCEMNAGADLSSLDPKAFDFVIDTMDTKLDGPNVFRMQKSTFLINGIQAGKNIYKQIDWYVKTGNLREIESLFAETMPDEIPCDAPALDKVSARAMANICTGCDCSKCMEACTMLKDFGNDIIDLNRAVGVTLNLFEHVDTREGTRQISGCTDCGLCKELCPKGIDIGAFLMNAKETIYKQGVIPHAYHDYWLRDYAHAESEDSFLFYMPKESSEYMFFPGCQTGASDPRYVTMSYDLLLKDHPDTSILLGCCGAPIKWSGDFDGIKEAHEAIEKYWAKAGRPVIVTSCPSCYKILRESLSEARVIMIYDLLDAKEIDLPFEKAAVFDPCSSREHPDMQSKVRNMAKTFGFELEELGYSGRMSQCCSYGHQIYDVNRNMVEKQVKDRITESDLPYIVYCSNCRDVFASRGKDVRHMLDLILGINLEGRGVPSLQERRTNRYELKKALIEKYHIDEKMGDLPKLCELYYDERIAKKMDDDLILKEDISSVISCSEEKGEYLLDNGSGHRFAHELRGIMTYWAEYVPEGEGYRVFNVYSHRVNIKGDVSVDR